jgi:hypothetical protein
MLKNMLKHIKAGILVPPQLKNNGAADANTYFDCAGLSGVLVLGFVGTTDAALGSTAATTPPYLEECDTTNGSYTKVTGSDLAAVLSATDDNKFFGIFVDRTKSRKRYLEVNAPTLSNGTTGANLAIIAIGFPADVFPDTAAKMGLKELIQV